MVPDNCVTAYVLEEIIALPYLNVLSHLCKPLINAKYEPLLTQWRRVLEKSTVTQSNTRLLWNPKVHYSVHWSISWTSWWI